MAYQVFQQDCVEWMRSQPADSIDTIVTSPPYNLVGFRRSRGGKNLPVSTVWRDSIIKYGDFTDDIDEPIYQQQQQQVINECIRILKPTGSLFYQHKIRRWGANSSHPMSWISGTQAIFYQEIIWDRGGTIAKDPHYLLPTTESIYWLTKKRPQVFRKALPENYRKVVWPIKLERQPHHPAPFPLQLATNCILLTTEPGSVVYDPYAGSGTTLLAAKQLGLDSIGTELSDDYIQLIHQRML